MKKKKKQRSCPDPPCSHTQFQLPSTNALSSTYTAPLSNNNPKQQSLTFGYEVEVGREQSQRQEDEQAGVEAAHGRPDAARVVHGRAAERAGDGHRAGAGAEDVADAEGHEFLGRVDRVTAGEGLGDGDVAEDPDYRDEDDRGPELSAHLRQVERAVVHLSNDVCSSSKLV